MDIVLTFGADEHTLADVVQAVLSAMERASGMELGCAPAMDDGKSWVFMTFFAAGAPFDAGHADTDGLKTAVGDWLGSAYDPAKPFRVRIEDGAVWESFTITLPDGHQGASTKMCIMEA